jgi:hypothetical protein
MLRHYFVFLCVFIFGNLASAQYDASLVKTTTLVYEGDEFQVIQLSRSKDRIKVKYFAAKDFVNNKSIYQRFNEWKMGRNVVLFSSGTYMDDYSPYAKPVGLTMDQGVMVNERLETNRLDALVIVYATGGIVVTNLKDGNLNYINQGSKVSANLNNSLQRAGFINWAKENAATVFQTHLLVYDNTLKLTDPLYSNCTSCKEKRERRFLAAVKDSEGKIYHVIVNNLNQSNSLYQATQKTLKYLNEMEDFQVVFMINLDTGAQDVFQFYKNNGSPHPILKGTKDLATAVNLLVYYFQ